MTDHRVEQFIENGFVKIEQAVPPDVAQACAKLLWAETGADPDDVATWTQPVHWVGDMAQEPFVQAANTAVLHESFDALVGPGRWLPRTSLGSFPLRFPHPDEPDDAGWHPKHVTRHATTLPGAKDARRRGGVPLDDPRTALLRSWWPGTAHRARARGGHLACF